MGNKRIILFFITGIFLCLVILIAGRGSRHFLAVPDQNSSFMVRGAINDIDSVVIERKGRRIEIHRDGLRWRMVAPVESGVDHAVMTRLINGFDSVAVKDSLGLDEIKDRGLFLSDYGLYPARARVAFHRPGKVASFLFGNTTASGGDVYVRRNNQNQIMVVPRSVYDVIPEDADSMRSRRLVDCDPALVNSIDIRRPGHPFIRLIMRSGVWSMEEPVSSKASQQRVDEFLGYLFNARVFKFVWPSLDNVMDVADYDKALKMRKGLYGLDDDTGANIHIHTVDGSFDSYVVIGHKAEKIGTSVYALLDRGMAIGAISNSFVDVVNVDPEFFRSMRIFDELADPLERLQFMVGKELFVLSRTNKLWRIDSPASGAADQEVVQKAVDRILSLQADRIANRVQRDESSDMNAESSYIEFSAGSLNVMASVKRADSEGQLYEFSFADQPEVYYVATSNMPPVLVDEKALLDFRDKTILSVPVGKISRVTIRKFGETALGVEFVGEDQSWHPVVGSTGVRLNQEVFSRVLDFLDGFRADKVVKVGLSADDPVYYGFSEPWLEINLDVNIEDAVRKTLLVGRSAGGNMRYVMLRGDQSIFLVDEQRLSVFAETLILNEK